jgi:hypothetical protein
LEVPGNMFHIWYQWRRRKMKNINNCSVEF